MQPESTRLLKDLIAQFEMWAPLLEQDKVSKLDFTVRPYLKESERVISQGTYSPRRIDRARNLNAQ